MARGNLPGFVLMLATVFTCLYEDLLHCDYTDVNECATNNGGCAAEASCSNTDGSFECTCPSGYAGDGFTCTGISLKHVYRYVTGNGLTCTSSPVLYENFCSPIARHDV